MENKKQEKSATEILEKMRMEQEEHDKNLTWEVLAKEKAEWEQERLETLKKIDEHYKTHKGGGMYYRWFDEDCYYKEQYFEKMEKMLRERDNQVDKFKVFNTEFEKANKKEQKPPKEQKTERVSKETLRQVEKDVCIKEKPEQSTQKNSNSNCAVPDSFVEYLQNNDGNCKLKTKKTLKSTKECQKQLEK